MKRVELTISGVPKDRYDIARKSRLSAARARAMVPEGGDICCLTLVDKLGIRPHVEYWWSRERDGHRTGEQVFDRRLLQERIPWMREHYKRSDGTAFTACHFRHSIHFTTFHVYQPKSQVELDAAAVKREAKRAERQEQAEREAAPLFAGGHS